jgi:hypothetical protein
MIKLIVKYGGKFWLTPDTPAEATVAVIPVLALSVLEVPVGALFSKAPLPPEPLEAPGTEWL